MRFVKPDYFNDCHDLRELCDRLNSAYDHARAYWREGRKVEEMIDTTSLPVYSESEPEDTSGIYSWDDNWVLKFGDFGFYMDKRGLDYAD